MRKSLVVLLVLFSAFKLSAQELNCTVSINSDNISGSNKQVYTTLENSLLEFVNQNKWTNVNYEIQERIRCNISIIILEQNGDTFKGTIQIQSSRPVYNSTYLSPVFNFKDNDFTFIYEEYEPLVYSETRFESNLVSVISFYAFMIIGLDASTFSYNGGKVFFEKAQNITFLSQGKNYVGWSPFGESKNNRYTLVTELLGSSYSSFNRAFYDYHRNGLDKMTEDLKKSKERIADSIGTLKSLYDIYPTAFLLRVFTDAKADEILSIFSAGPKMNTSLLKENLLKISPLNSNKWNKIK